MVAAEASGDLLGAHLIAALQERRPGLQFFGIGGPRMIAQGFDSQLPIERLGVRGYAEVLGRYREIAGIRRRLAARLLEDRPAAFIGVDSSDFNLYLERRLKDAGVPAIQYVSPAIWAWRGWRFESCGGASDDHPGFPPSADAAERVHRGIGGAMKEFAAAINERRKPSPNAEEILAAQEVLDHFYKRVRKHR